MSSWFWILHTVKPVYNGHSQRQLLVFNSNYRLMQVKSIAECSKGSILPHFRPSLSYHLSLRSLFCYFLVDILHKFYCICNFVCAPPILISNYLLLSKSLYPVFYAFASVHSCLVVAWKGLTSWLLLVMFNCVVTFPCGILAQVWYWIIDSWSLQPFLL